MANCKNELEKARRAFEMTMDRHAAQGLRVLERIQQQHAISGVHGPLFKLFKCSDMYTTAVEVIAGNSLFHVVVDNDDVAGNLGLMKGEEAGRLTFMPLNRLRPGTTKYPERDNCVLLIDQLEFDPRLRCIPTGLWQGIALLVT